MPDELKREAADLAAGRVESGMVVGLGTGSTAAYAVQAIASRLQRGELSAILGIPTSIRTRELAERVGIPLTTLNDHPQVDLTIDGADEVDPAGNLLKGGGGALLWEKIVAAATGDYVIVVDASKVVDVLGRTCPVPIEVVPFGWATHVDTIHALGGTPTLRRDATGAPFVTDGGHYILDCRFPDGLREAHRVDDVIRWRPGVVETGLFLDMTPEVIVGRPREP